MSKANEISEAARIGVCRVLRSLEGFRRGDDRLSAPGGQGAALEDEARNLGWRLVPTAAEAEFVVLLPGEPRPAGMNFPRARVIVDVGPACAGAPPGFACVADRPARQYQTLNAWIAGLALRLRLPPGLVTTCSALFRRLGVQDVVGSRLCALNNPAVRQRILVRADLADRWQETGAADRARDLAMSFFGIGHLPLFAANFASLAVVLLALPVWIFAGLPALKVACAAVAVVALAAGVVLEPWAERFYLAKDAREVVLDEVAGMSITLLFLTGGCTLWALGLAFLLFRIFDIFKFGVHWIERLPLRGTVMWDDVLAGLYAGAGLLVILRLT